MKIIETWRNLLEIWKTFYIYQRKRLELLLICEKIIEKTFTILLKKNAWG